MNSQERYFPKAELESNDMRHIAVPETAHYSGLIKISDEILLVFLVIKKYLIPMGCFFAAGFSYNKQVEYHLLKISGQSGL